MRLHGTLVKWNDARGFGFIARDQRDEELFVHISGFPRDGIRPRVGETLSFEMVASAKGRPRAVAIQRPSMRRARPAPPARSSHRGALAAALAIGCAAVIGVYAYPEFGTHRVDPESLVSPAPVSSAPVSPGSVSAPSDRAEVVDSFVCDGRTRCSQMTSCAEATWFMQHCPNTQMDGDHDGRPCEQQWCSQ